MRRGALSLDAQIDQPQGGKWLSASRGKTHKKEKRNKGISLTGEYDCSFNFWTTSALSKGGSAMHNHICAQSEKTFLEVWKSTATWENFCEPRSGIGRREGSHDEAGPGNKTEPECEHAGRKQPEDEEGVRAQP